MVIGCTSFVTIRSTLSSTFNQPSEARELDMMANGGHENGLHLAFLKSVRNHRPRASFELIHGCLGHVSFDFIKLLDKLGFCPLHVFCQNKMYVLLVNLLIAND